MRQLLRDVRTIRRLVTDPELSRSYFPDAPRKSGTRMLADLLLWRLQRGEVNQHYFTWGMDRVDGPRPAALLSYRQFQALRDGRNQRSGPGKLSYGALMRDKYLFALLLDALGHPTPRLLALVARDGVEWLRPRRAAPLASLLDPEHDIDGFCKPRFGAQGTGAFRLEAARGRLAANGEPVSPEALATRLGRHVLQERLTQHPALAALHAASVNTMRVVTVRDGDGARVFGRPVFRVGVGGHVIDNAAAGGIQLFVDLERERLCGPGILARGGTVTRHPDTGIALDGYEIPHLARAAALAAQLHHELPGLHSVGWDLAVTEDGPVFVEGNDRWSAGIRMGLEPHFKRDFERVCASP